MDKEPLFFLCLCFILGIILQDFFFFTESHLAVFLISSFLFFLFLFFSKNFLLYTIRPIILGVLFCAVGMFAHSLHTISPDLPKLNGKETIVFKLGKKLNSNIKNRRYEIIAWKGKSMYRSILSVPKSEAELDFAKYYKAEIFINPLEKPYSDFQFDYAKYLSRKGIYFQSYLPGTLYQNERIDLSAFEKIRQKRLLLLKKIDQSGLSPRSREFIKGIILADRTEMDRAMVSDFRNSGTMHLLAISGTHMAIIFGFILVFLNFLLPASYRKIKIVAALLLIWSFALFIGFGNSVTRSCVMITCYYIFVLLQRKTSLLHSMALAAFIILIADSNQIFDVGFQLSFAAVLGIFWFNQPLLQRMPRPKNKIQNLLYNIFSISLSAQLATMPLVIYYFHQYSLLSILANLIIIPFAEIIIIFSLCMVISIAFSIHSAWLNMAFDWFISQTLKTVHVFGNVNFALYKMIPMTLLEVFMLVIVLYWIRFFIIKINIKNTGRLVFFSLIFITLRFLLNYQAANFNEVLEHRLFKEKVISVKTGKQVIFYGNEKTDKERLTSYIIEPYLTSRRTKSFQLKLVRLP